MRAARMVVAFVRLCVCVRVSNSGACASVLESDAMQRELYYMNVTLFQSQKEANDAIRGAPGGCRIDDRV